MSLYHTRGVLFDTSLHVCTTKTHFILSVMKECPGYWLRLSESVSGVLCVSVSDVLCVNEHECVLVDDGCERGVGTGDRPANAVRCQQVSIWFCVAVLFETNAHLISGDLCLYMCRDVFCQMLCVLMLQSVIVCGLSCCHRNAVAVVLLRYLTPSCSSVTWYQAPSRLM